MSDELLAVAEDDSDWIHAHGHLAPDATDAERAYHAARIERIPSRLTSLIARVRELEAERDELQSRIDDASDNWREVQERMP